MCISGFPDMRGTPNVYHSDICLQELFGYPVPLTGQILVPGGRPVRDGERTGVVFDELPEASAFSRWQDKKFGEVERRYASVWRKLLCNLDLSEVANYFRKLGVDGTTCRTLDEAKSIALRITSSSDNKFDRMYLALTILGVSLSYYEDITRRWSALNYPPINQYAPYSSHVVSIELFFQIALAANLISSDRPSNRTDIAYLFYLPFCRVFVSSDKLHKKCAPMFLRRNQQFIWGPELKSGLRELNSYYLKLPQSIKDQGVIKFASQPPKEGNFYVSSVWDRHLPLWRKSVSTEASNGSEAHEKLVSLLESFVSADAIPSEQVDFDVQEPESLAIQRMVRRRKGSWFQLPKDISLD